MSTPTTPASTLLVEADSESVLPFPDWNETIWMYIFGCIILLLVIFCCCMVGCLCFKLLRTEEKLMKAEIDIDRMKLRLKHQSKITNALRTPSTEFETHSHSSRIYNSHNSKIKTVSLSKSKSNQLTQTLNSQNNNNNNNNNNNTSPSINDESAYNSTVSLQAPNTNIINQNNNNNNSGLQLDTMSRSNDYQFARMKYGKGGQSTNAMHMASSEWNVEDSTNASVYTCTQVTHTHTQTQTQPAMTRAVSNYHDTAYGHGGRKLTIKRYSSANCYNNNNNNNNNTGATKINIIHPRTLTINNENENENDKSMASVILSGTISPGTIGSVTPIPNTMDINGNIIESAPLSTGTQSMENENEKQESSEERVQDKQDKQEKQDKNDKQKQMECSLNVKNENKKKKERNGKNKMKLKLEGCDQIKKNTTHMSHESNQSMNDDFVIVYDYVNDHLPKMENVENNNGNNVNDRNNGNNNNNNNNNNDNKDDKNKNNKIGVKYLRNEDEDLESEIYTISVYDSDVDTNDGTKPQIVDYKSKTMTDMSGVTFNALYNDTTCGNDNIHNNHNNNDNNYNNNEKDKRKIAEMLRNMNEEYVVTINLGSEYGKGDVVIPQSISAVDDAAATTTSQ